jgi:hypothetical protein
MPDRAIPERPATRDRVPPPRLRALCLALPDVEERLSHGEPAWFVHGRAFVTLADHHHDDRVAFWAAAPPAAQETLVSSEPGRYFRPPYYGVRGWIGMYLDAPLDWDEVGARVREAYETLAQPRRS